ncbi:MAG: T9SS type A sorting domain-containing protein, partial [Candidatus Latescibacterota bacterium]
EEGFDRINKELIPADRGDSYTDTDVRANKTYWYRLGAVDADGEWMSPTVSVTVPGMSLALFQNTPNPFNPTTSISFALPNRSRATLVVYDVEGRHVKTLVDDVIDGGVRETVWDGTDARGHRVSSGVYFYRLTVGNKSLTKKMLLLK